MEVLVVGKKLQPVVDRVLPALAFLGELGCDAPTCFSNDSTSRQCT